jgi:phosphoribosyl 1,2-cyclic phosphate phosphodiesterase
MKLKYLGTAAAEGIPAVFCTCTVCTTARKLKGRHVRTRSQAVLDGTILFDFPPDSYAHYLGGGVDLPAIRHLFVTHSHMDHFFPAELALRGPVFIASTPIETLHIYGNRTVEALLAEAVKNAGFQSCNDFHCMTPFKPVDAEGYTVTALEARHNPKEECLNYIVQREGKALLYAHDTGIYLDATWDFLAGAGIRFDLVSLDCTGMTGNKGGNGHMGLAGNHEVRCRHFDLGAADKSTVFVVNHFSHNGGLDYDELSAAAGAEGYITSWDGLEIEV